MVKRLMIAFARVSIAFSLNRSYDQAVSPTPLRSISVVYQITKEKCQRACNSWFQSEGRAKRKLACMVSRTSAWAMKFLSVWLNTLSRSSLSSCVKTRLLPIPAFLIGEFNAERVLMWRLCRYAIEWQWQEMGSQKVFISSIFFNFHFLLLGVWMCLRFSLLEFIFWNPRRYSVYVFHDASELCEASWGREYWVSHSD